MPEKLRQMSAAARWSGSLGAPAVGRRRSWRAWPALLPTTLLLLAPLRLDAAIPAGERQVLINLYNATNGGGWASNANWCSGACPAFGAHTFNAGGTECTWYGITCDSGQAHVVAIGLQANRLQGTLPDISALGALQYFNVSSNTLGGALPALGALSQLQTFYAGYNQLTGMIPGLGGLSNLGDFAVPHNQLTGSIPSLAGLTNLYSLVVAANQLSGSMPSLAGPIALRDVDVSNNLLTGSLPSLPGLGTLLRFSAGHNRFSGAIPSLPPNLFTIDIGSNQLSGTVPAAPARLYTPVAYAPSVICPNALSLSPGGNDAGWNTASGFVPWWATPFPGNLCDDLFQSAFDP